MHVEVRAGDISAFQADAIVVNLFEGVTSPGGGTGAVDRAMGGAISRLIGEGAIKGKLGEFTLIHSLGKVPASRVVVAGLGESRTFTLDKVRDLSGDLARFLRRQGVRHAGVITHGAGIGGMDPEGCAQAIAEGTLMGLYRFQRHKTRPEEGELESLTLVEYDGSKLDALRRGVERGRILAEAANLSRDLANEPANYLSPSDLAARAESLARECGLECEVYGPQWMRDKGMGGILGVAAGSVQEPRFIVLRYRGAGEEPSIALVGKGITFDTGGISIKPAENMGEMKGDMTGGGAVIAAIGAIGKLRPRVNVMAVVPATENMPGGSAMRPGDVLKTMLGKTIEVVNTDAEGRLVLADAIVYARQQGAKEVIDVATLTGAITIALGPYAMGAMGNNDALMTRVKQAAAAAGERLWELPLWDDYFNLIKSDVADMKNSGGRPAGSITAAMLLKEFAEDTPWVHLDIASVDTAESEKGVLVKGSSGIPVRTLVNLVLQSAPGMAAAK